MAFPIGDVEASAPEVDDVASGPQLVRDLDDRDVVTEAVQPVGERWTGDACAGYQDPHDYCRNISALEFQAAEEHRPETGPLRCVLLQATHRCARGAR